MAEGVGGPAHPNPHDLERFLLGELAQPETNTVTAHLMRGCPQCRRRMAPLAAALFGRVGDRIHLAGEAAIDYDDAITHAFQNAGGLRHEAPGRPAAAPRAAARPAVLTDPPGSGEWEARAASAGPAPRAEGSRTRQTMRDRERCEALLERCVELRHRDAEALVLTATLAVNLAERIEGGRTTNLEVVDLRARSWAELGNALRIADDMTGSESALARSLEISGAGSGDPLLLARQMDLAASLLKDRRRFEEANALLTCVGEIYEFLGDDQAAGRALISQGITASVALDPAGAVQLLGAGLRKIDPERDPQLALASVHSLVWCLVDCGDLTLARRLFAITRDLYAQAGAPLIDLRARWLEARILSGLGDDEVAEATLREVRSQFEQASLFYDAALVTLDLVEILMRQGVGEEIERLLDETAAVFRARQIGRETLATLLKLREVTVENRLTTALLRRVARDLREQAV
jgi:hypothetical protein